MSTTVTYKGETLTTVSNDTAVLETGGTWMEDDLTLTDVTSGGTMQSKSNIDPTTSSQTITPDTGYDGLSSVQINAMPSGTAGTPTATKGTVSNHSIAVTPSVTNTTGYITGSTINGTAVTVSASELDSGSKSITANGNSQDVVGYASVDVAVPNSYSASDEGKVVSSGALVAQTSDTVTVNDTYDTTLINSLTVNVSGSSGWTTDGIVAGTEPSGAIVISNSSELHPCFSYNSAITSLTSSSITRINLSDGTLKNCTALKTLSLTGSITMATGNAFCQSCSNLETASLRNLTGNVQQYAFASCPKLSVLDLGETGQIQNNAIRECTILSVLILRKTTIPQLQSTGAFDSTPFASGGTGGTIYIPQSLYNHLGDGTSSDYRAASNWSTLYGYGTVTFAKIEGSIYE